ncbi:MAG: hypothetical protein V3T64_07760 [Myxococcota bacterium]
MSLPESLEQAATELEGLADQIRPANGDPHRLLEELQPDQAGELLAWILGREFDSAAELVEAWGETAAGAAILLGMPEQGLSKPGRKLLRKARHRLRSQGIEVVPSEPQLVASRRVVAVEDSFEAALISSPDFRGARVGYLADRHPAGGARLFEIRFDESRGILDFRVYNAGRSKVRGFLRTLSSARAQRLFDVPRPAFCALVRRASLAQPADRPLPTGFIEWRGRLFSEAIEKEATPGALARAALVAEIASGDSDSALDSVLTLIAEGEVGPWPPPTGRVSEWMEQGREGVEGLEAEARIAAIESWLVKVSDDLAASTDRDLLARHLEELAWIRWQSEAPELARSLVSVADAVLDNEAVALRVARARAESLFATFLVELRVVEENPLRDPAADAN